MNFRYIHLFALNFKYFLIKIEQSVSYENTLEIEVDNY